MAKVGGKEGEVMALWASLCSVRATEEAFHSIKNSGLKFMKFPVFNGLTFT